MKKCEITYKNHFNHIWPLIVFQLMFGIGCFYIVKRNDGVFSVIAQAIFIGWSLFHLLPTLSLHINYYFTNKYDVLVIGEVVSIMHKNDLFHFNINDIKHAYVYKSFALSKGNIQLLSWDSYNHMVIELENGTQIILTSLLMGIHNPLPIPEEKIVVKMNFFRWVNGKSIRFPRSLKD